MLTQAFGHGVELYRVQACPMVLCHDIKQSLILYFVTMCTLHKLVEPWPATHGLLQPEASHTSTDAESRQG
jgi:hypothetical protein